MNSNENIKQTYTQDGRGEVGTNGHGSNIVKLTYRRLDKHTNK